MSEKQSLHQYESTDVAILTLKQVLDMTYDEYVSHLLKKYGPAKCDYFKDESCKSKGNISRTKEGLECHHIDEDKEQLLSDPIIAAMNPFDYQRANRLVYCDKVEHLLLHIKIIREFRPKNNWWSYYMDGPRMIISSINDYYKDDIIANNWHGNMKRKIVPKFDEYIFILYQIVIDLMLNEVDTNEIFKVIFASFYGIADTKIILALENLVENEKYTKFLTNTAIDLYYRRK